MVEEGVENRSVVRGWSSGVLHQANMASECGRYDRWRVSADDTIGMVNARGCVTALQRYSEFHRNALIPHAMT